MKDKQYMIEFEVDPDIKDVLEDRLPDHHLYISRLLADGTLQSYALSQDRQNLWAVIVASNIEELYLIIDEMPLADYLTPYVSELIFHNAPDQVLAFSLN